MKVRHDTIGGRIAEARRTIGVSVDDFSQETGIPVSTIKKYESGIRVPGGEALQAIARIGINAHWILTGEGPQRISDLRTETPGAFDAEQLRLALETVEEGLAATGRQLAPDKKADLVTAVYELLAGDAQVDRGVILRLVKSVG